MLCCFFRSKPFSDPLINQLYKEWNSEFDSIFKKYNRALKKHEKEYEVYSKQPYEEKIGKKPPGRFTTPITKEEALRLGDTHKKILGKTSELKLTPEEKVKLGRVHYQFHYLYSEIYPQKPEDKSVSLHWSEVQTRVHWKYALANFQIDALSDVLEQSKFYQIFKRRDLIKDAAKVRWLTSLENYPIICATLIRLTTEKFVATQKENTRQALIKELTAFLIKIGDARDAAVEAAIAAAKEGKALEDCAEARIIAPIVAAIEAANKNKKLEGPAQSSYYLAHFCLDVIRKPDQYIEKLRAEAKGDLGKMLLLALRDHKYEDDATLWFAKGGQEGLRRLIIDVLNKNGLENAKEYEDISVITPLEVGTIKANEIEIPLWVRHKHSK